MIEQHREYTHHQKEVKISEMRHVLSDFWWDPEPIGSVPSPPLVQGMIQMVLKRDIEMRILRKPLQR